MRGVVLDVLADVADNARNYGVALRPAVGRDLPEVQADRGQIHAVVLNFVENAIEAMTEVSGRARVLEVECRFENPETLVVSVRDSGTGIAAEDRDRVIRSVLHRQDGRDGYGPRHEPLDRRSPRGTAVGDAERRPRRHVPFLPSGRPRQ